MSVLDSDGKPVARARRVQREPPSTGLNVRWCLEMNPGGVVERERNLVEEEARQAVAGRLQVGLFQDPVLDEPRRPGVLRDTLQGTGLLTREPPGRELQHVTRNVRRFDIDPDGSGFPDRTRHETSRVCEVERKTPGCGKFMGQFGLASPAPDEPPFMRCVAAVRRQRAAQQRVRHREIATVLGKGQLGEPRSFVLGKQPNCGGYGLGSEVPGRTAADGHIAGRTDVQEHA